MQQIEEKSFRKNLILVTGIAIVFSSFTLWLIESHIKYALFVFEIILIVVIYFILRNYELPFEINRFQIKYSKGIISDISLITFSVILIFFNISNLENFVLLPLAFICTVFLIGNALLNIGKLEKYFSRLETILLSFFIGFIFSSLCTLALLWMDENSRVILIPTIFIIIGIISGFTRIKKQNEESSNTNSLSKKIDIVAIGTSIAFYVLFFYYIYPEFALVPGTDISRHFSFSQILSRTPDLYTGFSYLLFHSFDSTVNTLSGVTSIEFFQTLKVGLNLFFPLVVYVFSKRFLEKIDKRIPALSTLFFSVFSNFSFLYYLQLKLQETDYTVLEMLGRYVAQKSYYSSIYFSQSFAWFVPQSIGFMIFIFLLLLLGIRSIPSSRLIPLMTILILSLTLIHLPQALIFVIFLSFFSLLSKSQSLRLNEGLVSCMLGLTGSIIAVLYINSSWELFVRDAAFPFQVVLYTGSLIPLTIFSIFWRKKILLKLNFLKGFKLTSKSSKFLSIILVSIYLLALLTWFFVDFKSSDYHEVGVVPWFIYPLILGIPGLLFLTSIRYFYKIFPNSFLFLILMIIPIMIILGQILSFVNLNIQQTNFWEKRLLMYIFLSASLISPIILIKFVDRIDINRKLLSKVTLSIVISMIVIAGFSSMSLQSEFWFLANKQNAIQKDEIEAVNYLKEIFNSDQRAYTIAPSKKSMSIVTFSSSPYQLHKPEVTSTSKNPDLPLFTLRAHNLPHAYLYVHERDIALINGSKNWFLDHLIPLLPTVFKNEQVTIYNSSQTTFPLSHSDTTLIVPIDNRINFQDSWLFAYDMVSQNNVNYTVMYDTDHNALKSKTVLLSYDPPLDSYPNDYLDDFSLPSNWKILSGNWNFSNNGLIGKLESGSLDNIMLSPVSTTDSTIKTSFKILSADPDVANYISIIYDWKDSDNFSSARATFYRDQQIWLAFDTMKDGQKTTFPTWPGTLTKHVWKPGDIINMTLSKHGDREELFLNGTKYLIQQEGIGKSGDIGFSVDRIEKVFFDHFNIQRMNELNQRPISDYVSYVISGGNLIVLNTNGNGAFSDLFLKSNDLPTLLSENLNYTNSNSMKDDNVPNHIQILDMDSFKNTLPKNLQRDFPEDSSILVMEKHVGNGKITFVNVYPFISDFHEGNIKGNDVYKILISLFGSLDLDKITSQPITSKKIPLIFRNLDGSGNVRINTNSMLFPSDIRLTNLELMNNNKIIKIKNVTELAIEDYDRVVIQSKNVSLINGNGLYSKIILDNSIHLEFIKNAIVSLSDDKQSLHFEKVSNIMISNKGPINVIVRQPTIHIDGSSTLSYPTSALLYSLIRDNAESLNVIGNVTLTLFMSDTLNYATNVKIEGQTERYPPLLDKDYFSSLTLSFSEPFDLNVILIPFLLIPFIIVAILLGYNPKKKMNQN